ncbi:signal peptide peptidase SppA [Thermoanaerobacterium sp. RBIITD]|uniref:signal peptide peptidase SppA n=1 Tax=Thermoanaerobacterium sp. RBIITD TaxID=1550240 RepID=UPI000BB979A4|nr:signal peptide peptidase SppA [Thermoanaerobacterium sp. RBIITD]SNX55110.1 signal peptide peptidase A. Serine peptidase. MEROPS family S49 [Thermoanaerobacterium sp. RBIITD]
MNKKTIFGIVISVVVVIAAVLSMIYSMPRTNRQSVAYSGSIGVITIDGVIGDNSSIFGLSQDMNDPVEQIRRAMDDKSVKAVVVRINSPGGSSAKSVEIYEELKKLKKSGKKIIVSMGDTAASGGYMAAVAGDTIVANPATLTGSIGVIMEYTNYEGLYKMLGLKEVVIKSAEHKDIGSPTRDLTPDEQKILQDIINDTYDQFINIVSEGRKMPYDKVKSLADGRVFSGRQALKLGLVDKLGDFYDAVDIAAKSVGIKGNPQLIYYTRTNPLGALFGSSSKSDISKSAIEVLRLLFIDRTNLNYK